MYSISFFSVFFHLLKTHMTIVMQQLWGKVLNLYIWIACSIFVTGYVMQAFGLTSSFGSFQFASSIATIGLFEVYGNAVRSIMDFEGDRTVSYHLTLPTKSWVVLCSMASSYTCVGVILSFLTLPIGKILLFKSFSFSDIAWFKFVVIVIMANLFFASFTLAVTAYIRSMLRIENVWSRFIFPLWYLGGFQFSWESLYKLSPTFAYALLLNPVLYVMEGTRAALLGQEGYISWWLCLGAITIFSAVCWTYAYYTMKRLLDFV